MATAAKFVLSIPIFLAYLVPLDIILIIPLSASILSVPFLGDALIKLYETL
jgi:hypothetical protein